MAKKKQEEETKITVDLGNAPILNIKLLNAIHKELVGLRRDIQELKSE